MLERITPATRKLLEQAYLAQTQRVIEEGVQKGKLMQEGDGYHSESGQRMEEQALLSSELALEFSKQLRDAVELRPPSQNNFVELGHRIKTHLLNDEEVIAYAKAQGIEASEVMTSIHLLSSIDSQYLPKILPNLNGITEIIASDKSPIGKALLHATRNDLVRYGKDLRAQVLDTPDAIETSPLLNLEIILEKT